MKQDNFDIISKWLIKGFPDYCFGSDKELYRLPYKSKCGRNHYGLLRVKKQDHNRWLIHGKMWSERQLADKIYLNPNPQVSQRVLFVGMHNKPGMKPLDSKTMSGKMIDAVIKELPFKCTKTNLFEGEYLPTDFLEINNAGIEWHKKYEPHESDVVVLLGRWVQENFWHNTFKIVKLPHPASSMGNVNKENYIKNAIYQITKAVS